MQDRCTGEPCRPLIILIHGSVQKFKKDCCASAPRLNNIEGTVKRPEMERMLQSRPVSLLVQVLLFLSLPLAFCFDAAADYAPLHVRQSVYADHDVVLNASRHDEEFFTFLSVRSEEAPVQCSQVIEVLLTSYSGRT